MRNSRLVYACDVPEVDSSSLIWANQSTILRSVEM